MQKFYSVVVEMQDGKKRTLPAQAPTPSGVFQQLKAMPEIRRVGKVTEIGREAFDALQGGRDVPAGHAEGRHAQAGSAAPQRERAEARGSHSAPAQHARSHDAASAANPAHHPRHMGNPHAVAGPRVVSHARRSGGEQPFRHLKAPPERPKPPKPVVAAPKHAAPAAAAIVKPVVPVAHVEETDSDASNAAQPREYRIAKSRRKDGDPYLLQRGYWHQLKGKRVFAVEWEKGFAERGKAERHQEWVQQHAKETAEASAEG